MVSPNESVTAEKKAKFVVVLNVAQASASRNETLEATIKSIAGLELQVSNIV
jgi:hypothetical protein